MDLIKIKQLIDVLTSSDLAEIELVEGTHRVRLVRRMPEEAARPTYFPAATPKPAAETDASESSTVDPIPAPTAHSDSAWVTAPLYGVLHLTPAPAAPAFVQVGEVARAGQTLCVIEAMKVFHEVKLEREARIAALLVNAGDEVEAGAALFRLEAADPDV